MKRSTDATGLLIRLLERHERSAGGRRIIERPSQAFDDPAELRALVEILKEAEQAGAVEVLWDRDATHLIDRVVLADPARLYAFTGRTPADEVLAAALRALDEVSIATEPARALVQDLASAWTDRRKLVALGPSDIAQACALVRATDAAFMDLGPDVPLRTRSARTLGDSKALERLLPTLIAYLRQTGMIDSELSREEAIDQLGLAKFAQPVLVAGPLTVGGLRMDGWPYVGVPPDLVEGVRPATPVRSVLTIENLESFNRHVRSSRLSGDVVVYSGGFPSGAVLSLLRAILPSGERNLHHWGDIDPGGIRIGRHLETALGATLRPHLMDVELARRLGRPPEERQLAPSLPSESAFSDLAAYLRLPDVRWLEQEVVDPQPICAGELAAE